MALVSFGVAPGVMAVAVPPAPPSPRPSDSRARRGSSREIVALDTRAARPCAGRRSPGPRSAAPRRGPRSSRRSASRRAAPNSSCPAPKVADGLEKVVALNAPKHVAAELPGWCRSSKRPALPSPSESALASAPSATSCVFLPSRALPLAVRSAARCTDCRPAPPRRPPRRTSSPAPAHRHRTPTTAGHPAARPRR